MKTRLCLCLLVSLLSVMQGVAQTVFEAEMGNTQSFDGWELSNAEKVETAEGLDFVLGKDGVNTGYAITPELLLTTIKTPNGPQVTFYMKVDDTSTALNVTAENGGTIDNATTFTCNTTGWYKKTLHISGGNDRTRLKFESNGDNNKKIYLLNLTVEQRSIFNETFSRVSNSLGNNGFNGAGLSGYVLSSSFDNTNSNGTVCSADKCVFLSGTDYFTTPKLNISPKAVVSFRAAGDINYGANIDVKFAQKSSSKIDKTFTTVKGKWNTYKAAIKSYINYVTISGKYFFLDDVKVYYPLTLTLSDNTDLTTPIARQKDEIVDVTVNRTFPADQWCTLCLPFDVSQSDITTAAGAYNEATIRTLNRVDGGTFYFDPVEKDTVKAGTPFLIKLSQQLVNPTFSLVTITATKPKVDINADGYGFAGTFSPITLNTDGTHAFLAGADAEGNQYIYTPAAGKNTMNGLRAYFVLPGKSSNARIHIADEDELSAISEHRSTDRRPARAGISDLSGRRMSSGRASLSKGIYIVDGRKTIVK